MPGVVGGCGDTGSKSQSRLQAADLVTRRRAWRGSHGGGDTCRPRPCCSQDVRSPPTPSQPRVCLLPGPRGVGRGGLLMPSPARGPVRTASPIGLCFIQGGWGETAWHLLGPWAGAREGPLQALGPQPGRPHCAAGGQLLGRRVSLGALGNRRNSGLFKPPYALSRELHVLSPRAPLSPCLDALSSAWKGKNKIGGSTVQCP